MLASLSLLALLSSVPGCGSDGDSNGAADAAPGAGGGLSCDINRSSDSHICIASTGYGGVAGDSNATKSNCTTAGGTLGTGCDRTGVVAGCRGTGAGGGSYITFTYWYYFGTVDSVGTLCTAAAQTLVQP